MIRLEKSVKMNKVKKNKQKKPSTPSSSAMSLTPSSLTHQDESHFSILWDPHLISSSLAHTPKNSHLKLAQ